MIKIKQPLRLSSLSGGIFIDDGFAKRILGNYEIFAADFSALTLIHLMWGEEEAASAPGITTVICNENLKTKVTLNYNILNQFINRAMAVVNRCAQYRDYIYVERFLCKAGIRDTRTFLTGLALYLGETEHIGRFLHLYRSNEKLVSRFFDYIAEAKGSSEAGTETAETMKNAFSADAAEDMQRERMCSEFAKKLFQKINYAENTAALAGLSGAGQTVSGMFSTAMARQLDMLLEYQEKETKLGGADTLAAEYRTHINYFEEISSQAVSVGELLENLLSAALLNLVDTSFAAVKNEPHRESHGGGYESMRFYTFIEDSFNTFSGALFQKTNMASGYLSTIWNLTAERVKRAWTGRCFLQNSRRETMTSSVSTAFMTSTEDMEAMGDMEATESMKAAEAAGNVEVLMENPMQNSIEKSNAYSMRYRVELPLKLSVAADVGGGGTDMKKEAASVRTSEAEPAAAFISELEPAAAFILEPEAEARFTSPAVFLKRETQEAKTEAAEHPKIETHQGAEQLQKAEKFQGTEYIQRLETLQKSELFHETENIQNAETLQRAETARSMETEELLYGISRFNQKEYECLLEMVSILQKAEKARRKVLASNGVKPKTDRLKTAKPQEVKLQEAESQEVKQQEVKPQEMKLQEIKTEWGRQETTGPEPGSETISEELLNRIFLQKQDMQTTVSDSREEETATKKTIMEKRIMEGQTMEEQIMEENVHEEPVSSIKALKIDAGKAKRDILRLIDSPDELLREYMNAEGEAALYRQDRKKAEILQNGAKEALPESSRKIFEVLRQYYEEPEETVRKGIVTLHSEGLLTRDIYNAEQTEYRSETEILKASEESFNTFLDGTVSTAAKMQSEEHEKEKRELQSILSNEYHREYDEALMRQLIAPVERFRQNEKERSEYIAVIKQILWQEQQTALRQEALDFAGNDERDGSVSVELSPESRERGETDIDTAKGEDAFGMYEMYDVFEGRTHSPVYGQTGGGALSAEGSVAFIYNGKDRADGEDTKYSETGQTVSLQTNFTTENTINRNVQQTCVYRNENGKGAEGQRRFEETRFEETLKQQVGNMINHQLTAISEKVYDKLEKKLANERRRRGY